MAKGAAAMMDRRRLLAGAAALAGTATFAAAAHAEVLRVNGTFGLRATADGLADIQFEEEGGGEINPALAWHMGSNTKAMTALLYAALVEQGACGWGASLSELFPAIPIHPQLAEATVEELMAHAAGLTDQGIAGTWLMARHMDRSSPAEQRRAFAREWLGRPPTTARGTFAYANANYIVLGAAIEQATGVSWEEAMRQSIFAPLGLSSASFGAPLQEKLWGRQTFGAAGAPVNPAGLADNPPVFGPAGTVHMTPADYARFLSLYLRGGSPLLEPASLTRLLRPPRPELNYAGGWGLAGDGADENRLLMHDGSNTMWYVRAVVNRVGGRAYAAGTNRGGQAGLEAAASMIAMLRAENV